MARNNFPQSSTSPKTLQEEPIAFNLLTYCKLCFLSLSFKRVEFMSSIFIPSLATVRKFGGMARFGGGPEELCSGQNGHSEHSGSADLVKILLRITHRKCIVSGLQRLVYQNI